MPHCTTVPYSMDEKSYKFITLNNKMKEKKLIACWEIGGNDKHVEVQKKEHW